MSHLRIQIRVSASGAFADRPRTDYIDPFLVHTGLSLEELGLRALQNIPRERAINGIHAFNEMRLVLLLFGICLCEWLNHDVYTHRDKLLSHLRPIAEQNREVTAADIHAFFEEAKQGKSSN